MSWFCRVPSVCVSQMIACKIKGGFTGYRGGIAGFAEDKKLLKRHWMEGAMNMKVLHVTGNTHQIKTQTETVHQYQPVKFSLPLFYQAIDGGATALAVFITERSTKKGFASALCFGDYEDVWEYLSTTLLRHPWHPAVFYYYHDATKPVKCYLDIDKYSEDKHDEEIMAAVIDTIKRVTTALNKDTDAPKKNYSIVGGVRLDQKKFQYKHSYHVTWHDHIFHNMAALRVFLAGVLSGVDTDFKAYGSKQQMRCPGSGKGGNSAAALYPMHVRDGRIVGLPDTKGFVITKQLFIDMDIIPRRAISSYVSHHVDSSKERMVTAAAPPSSSSSPINAVPLNWEDVQRHSDMICFWKPIFWKLVELIQQHRRRLRQAARTCSPGCAVPIGDVSYFLKEWDGRLEGCFHFTVDGDTFCEHDQPNYFHSDNQRLRPTIQVDLTKGRYCQLCFACSSGGRLKWYNLFTDKTMHIHSTRTGSTSRLLQFTEADDALAVFLMSLRGSIAYHPSLAGVYMYEKYRRCWVDGERAADIVSVARNTFNSTWRAYVVAASTKHFEDRKQAIQEGPGTMAQKSKMTAQIEKQAATVGRKLPLMDLLGMSGLDRVKANYLSVYPVAPVTLDCYPEMVPLPDGTCFNVYTGRVVPRTKQMYCTKTVEVNVKEEEDEECMEVRNWFREVSAGRPELATYLMRLTGYFCTLLDHDRHFYCNIGVGRNGKGVFHNLLRVPLPQI